MRKETEKTPVRIAGRAKLEPATGGSRHSTLYRPSYRSFSRGAEKLCVATMTKAVRKRNNNGSEALVVTHQEAPSKDDTNTA